MANNIDFLKMRVLMSLYKMNEESCNVTSLAKTLAVEKYSISRAMVSLEKEGLLDRKNLRRPKLTARGRQEAEKYSERMDIATNHLIYEGVTEIEAQRDAMFLSMFCSEETFQVIKSMEESYRIKHMLRDRKKFNGGILCSKLRDGKYQYPFIVYRKSLKDGSNISMANDGFQHPCSLYVKKGIGTVSIKAKGMSRSSQATGLKMTGKISSLKYFDGTRFCDAEKNGDLLSFPAEALEFINMGDDISRILHGSLCMKMTCTVGPMHMPESTAIFTILI